MFSNIRRARAFSVVILMGLAAAPMLSHAGDSGCEQARRDAWFEQQRALTDGNTSPFVKTLECKKDAATVAKNDVDAPKQKTSSKE